MGWAWKTTERGLFSGQASGSLSSQRKLEKRSLLFYLYIIGTQLSVERNHGLFRVSQCCLWTEGGAWRLESIFQETRAVVCPQTVLHTQNVRLSEVGKEKDHWKRSEERAALVKSFYQFSVFKVGIGFERKEGLEKSEKSERNKQISLCKVNEQFPGASLRDRLTTIENMDGWQTEKFFSVRCTASERVSVRLRDVTTLGYRVERLDLTLLPVASLTFAL